jgi:hypothetical protein
MEKPTAGSGVASVIVMIAAGDVPGPQQLQRSHQSLIDLRARLVAPSAGN